MSERFGLRLRVALFFVALALAGVAVIAGALWVGHARYGGPLDGYVIAGLIAGFAVAGLCAWVGFLFDENLARPILGLASDLHTRARANVDSAIDVGQARYLGALAPAATAIHDALEEARAAQARAVERETAQINREKALFAALLQDLAEGAVVVNSEGRIMLYNRVARDLLGELGLDRRISAFLRIEPVQHAIDRLTARRGRGEAEAESFMAATVDGERFLLGRLSPVTLQDERIGHVLIFHDATDDLKAHAERDHLFNTLLEQVRRPAAAISALLDVLEADPEMPEGMRAKMRAGMSEEMDKLFAQLRASGEAYGAATARRWPMAAVAVRDIFDALAARDIAEMTFEPGEQFLHCDGFAVIGLLALVLDGMAQGGGRAGLTLSAEPRDGEIWLTIGWDGEEAPDGLLDSWVRRNVSEAYGQYTGRDVLEMHRTEIWSETLGRGHRIVLPLPAAGAPILAPRDARPEFYDFQLSQQGAGDLADRPLAELSFVVFDTETTGLSPAGGDEIVQISGVRVLNGRILTGEVFDRLVHPGRPIPPASTAVHKITDAMVEDAPAIDAVGNAFHGFCEGAVLVAHNAPFDMAFLRRKEAAIGLRFENPVLCTVLLSAALFEHTGQHTLDALAERFGITIPEELRHTALGDAMATAEVFVQMLEVMRSRGIETLGQAIEAGQRMTRIRKAQDY